MTPEAGSAPASAHVGGGLFAMPATRPTRRSDGSAVLRSTIPLGTHAARMAQSFRAAADVSAQRMLAAQREGGGWRTITYGLAREKVDGLAQAHPALEPAGDRSG